MAFAARQLAPIAAPPPPKPPQLNIVASALMPDVVTDTFGPGEEPALTAAGGFFVGAEESRGGLRRTRSLYPGVSAAYRERMEMRNALVASIDTMKDVDMQQAEEAAGITWDSLPESIFPAVADSRWTGGFAYAPENQYRGLLRDWAGQAIDTPYMTGNGGVAPTAGAAAPSSTGGHLTAAHGAYSYLLASIYQDGSLGATSAAFTGTISSGIIGSNVITWTDSTAAGVIGVAVFGRDTTSYKLLATVKLGTQTFTDTGQLSVTYDAAISHQQPQLGNLPMVGYVPFLIQVRDQASAWGWSQRDYVGRALRLLDFTTPNALERELWSGAWATSGSADGSAVYQSDFPNGMNAFLTQTGTPTSGGSSLVPLDLTPNPAAPPSITRGIQILEDYLANTGSGGQGMVHLAPQTSPNLLGARRVGALLLSVMDNIIVPGSGYPTSGSQGPLGNSHVNASSTTAWLFCTDLVSVRLDAPNVYPSTFAEAISRGQDGEPNTVKFRAERFASATWDGARLAAVLVTLAT